MQARTIAALAAVVACVLVGGAGGGVAADTFAGTWNLAPAPGTPWSGGGTLTISPASSTAVPGATGQVAWDSYVKGYCTGPPSPGATAAKVRAWYALHYSWSGGGSMGGCVSDKTNGQLIFFGSGSMGHVQGRNGNQIFGDWTNNPNGSSRFSATLASGGGGTTGATASVAEPAPDHAVAITSPDALPLAALGLVSVTGSAGDTKGTTIVAEGSITAKALGNLVAECWLIWEPDPEDGDLSSGAKLRWCIAMVKGTLEAYAHRKPASVSADVPEVASVAPRLGVGGCRVERLTFSARVSKGKATAIKPIKAALTAKSVRYGCSASGGTLKIKVDGRVKGGLPKQLGPKLDLKVVRNDTAPKRSNKLTFGFSW